MSIEIYRSLEALPENVVELSSYPRCGDFFVSLDWFRNLHETSLGKDFEPLVLAFTPAGKSTYVVFCGTRDGGRTVSSMTNFYSVAWSPVCNSPAESGDFPIVDFLQAVRKAIPQVREINLRFMRDEASDVSASLTTLRRSKFFTHRQHQYRNWFYPVGNKSFEKYYAERSSRLRNTIKRKEKKLQREIGYDMQVHDKPGPELDAAITDYVAVYNQSWKKPEPFPDFTPGLARVAAALGVLRLGILKIEGQPAAAQLWINTPRRAMIYKLAYTDEHARYSPGSILSREMFRIALDEDAVGEIDYGVGDENYKRDWMSTVRDLYGVQASNILKPHGLAATAYHLLSQPARLLKSSLRST